MKAMIKMAAIAVATISVYAVAESLEERIKPAGSVCMEGESCAAAAVQMAASGEARSGQAIYDTKCKTCHATGAANAPKLGDTATWAPRIAKGMDALYESAIKGFKGMPAKGLCFDCSDDELKASVDYMVENSK